PWQPLDTFLLQYRIERTARAAVGVGDEDLCVVCAVLLDDLTYRRRDALGSVVQLRGEATHLERAPAVGAPQRRDLARERPAGDDQGDGARIHVSSLLGNRQPALPPRAPPAARRAASSVLAVSTAMAASRQYATAPTALPNSSFSGAPPTNTM